MGYFSFRLTQRLIQLFTSSLLLCLMWPLISVADPSQNSDETCGESEIRYEDDPSLPRAERLKRMHQAFIDSVNRFEACELTNQASSPAGDGAAGGEGAGSDGAAGNNTATASQEMQGTEAEAETFPETTAESFSDENALEKPPGINNTNASANNGAIPEDIPETNNDDAVAAQIRVAAENETDPEIREKLWNEYRKYKGMEIVE